MKEKCQLHDMQAFFTREADTLTRGERIKALSSLIFLKQKTTGEFKGCTWVNGAPQREYISKGEAASPTAAMDLVFMIRAINTYQRRDLVTMDLLGAFLHTLNNEKIIMVLKGELCKLICKVDPKIYRK